MFMQGVSITHPVLAAFYMFCASVYMWRVSLTHPMLVALCGVFLLHFHAIFFMMVVSFPHGEFLLHVPCWLYNVGSFYYTSRAGFLMWGVSLTCSLEADGCFMLGLSLTYPMDVLTIATAYQQQQNKLKNISIFEKENK